nr:hypothetical protein Iba_chr12dCG12220 [Ipomoea batatas]
MREFMIQWTVEMMKLNEVTLKSLEIKAGQMQKDLTERVPEKVSKPQGDDLMQGGEDRGGDTRGRGEYNQEEKVEEGESEKRKENC